jgi:hypothetical protein
MKSVPKKHTVLKLIYHTVVFGPIDLEYDRPVIRVGSSEDNDLVLRHPSIEPHHCLLVFRGEKVLCLPPGQPIPLQTDLGTLTGQELGAGDSIAIGDLQFSLAHSSRTVAVPGVDGQDSSAGGSRDGAPTGPGENVAQQHYYCAHCQAFIQATRVKRLGLVGHAKRNLCPKCSHPLETKLTSQEPAPEMATRRFR